VTECIVLLVTCFVFVLVVLLYSFHESILFKRHDELDNDLSFAFCLRSLQVEVLVAQLK